MAVFQRTFLKANRPLYSGSLLTRTNRINTPRLFSSVKVRDEWESEEFAKKWSKTGHLRTNPDRRNQLSLLATLVKTRWKKGDNVLDIGCGSGLSSAPIFSALPKDATIVGVDGNQAMLQLCKENAPGMDTHECSFGDLSNFDLGKKFEHIYAVQTLHEVDDDTKSKVFEFVKRSIQPNGTFYILDRFLYNPVESTFLNEYEGAWNFLTSDKEADVKMNWEEYNAAYVEVKDDFARTEQDYITMLQNCGFEAEILYKMFNRSLIVARVV